ncbi:MAG TPA: hypothetical protein DCM05_18220 [Elusimicrobia bacterium]|nr:hypothetical protein [Elusimicrobiota bacterium]
MSSENFDIYAFIGKRIREERQAQDRTLEDVASAAGTDRSFLQQIETNKRKPSIIKVYHIATALGLTLDQLFKGCRKPAMADPDEVFARKVSSLVREAGPEKRDLALRVLKNIVKAD